MKVLASLAITLAIVLFLVGVVYLTVITNGLSLVIGVAVILFGALWAAIHSDMFGKGSDSW